MKFCKKYYVGFQKQRYNQTDDQRLLGFAIPFDDETVASLKRKETVDHWREKDIEPLVFDNVPTFGFKIVDTVTRYMNDNKLFRILDPRGFELEITVDNLFRILNECTVVKAQIMEPLLWGRTDTGKNYLIPGQSEEYLHFLKPKKTVALEVGQYFTHPANKNIVYRYDGKRHYISVTSTKVAYDPTRGWSYNDARTIKRQKIGVKSTYCKYELKTDHKEPFEIYSEFRLNASGDIEKTMIHLRKSKLKDLEYKEDGFAKADDFTIPYNTFLAGKWRLESSRKNQKEVIDFISAGYSVSFPHADVALFQTKKEAQAFSSNIDKLKNLFGSEYDYYYVNRGVGSYRDLKLDKERDTIYYDLYHNGQLVEEQ